MIAVMLKLVPADVVFDGTSTSGCTVASSY